MRLAGRFLPWLGLALVIVIAAVAVREITQALHDNSNAKATQVLADAMQSGDSIAALKKAAGELDGHHAALAKLIAFQRMDLEQQKTDGLLMLDSLAADAQAPKEWRDFAALTATKARIAFGAKAKDADALVTTLEPAASDDKSPWQTPARVQIALIKSEMQNDPEGALAALKPIDTKDMESRMAEQIDGMRLHYEAQLLKQLKEKAKS